MVAVGQECRRDSVKWFWFRLCPKIVLGVHQGCSHLEAWARTGCFASTIVHSHAGGWWSSAGSWQETLAPLQTSPQGCFRHGNWLCPGWVKWRGRQRDGQRQRERKQTAAFPSADIYLLSLTHSGGKKSENKVLRFEGRNFKEFAETF